MAAHGGAGPNGPRAFHESPAGRSIRRRPVAAGWSHRAPWFAFLVHLRKLEELDDWRTSALMKRHWANDEEWHQRVLAGPPFVISTLKFRASPVTGELIVIPRLPEDIVFGEGRKLIARAVQIAAERGARVVGLGGLTAPATRGGASLLPELADEVTLTTGNAFTAAVARQNVRDACRHLRRPRPLVAVLGATGSVGVAATRLLAEDDIELLLLGRSKQRLRRALPELDRRAEFATDLAELHRADIVLVLTSDPSARITPEHFNDARGQVVIDVAQPANVDVDTVAQLRAYKVEVVRGGWVHIPGATSSHDAHSVIAAEDQGAPAGSGPACLAETCLFAVEGVRTHAVGAASTELARRMEASAVRRGVRVLPLALQARPRPSASTTESCAVSPPISTLPARRHSARAGSDAAERMDRNRSRNNGYLDICITGVGAITPLGNGAQTLHDRWTAGDYVSDDGRALCGDFSPEAVLTRRELRILDRFAQMALCAAEEAITQAGWGRGLPTDPERIGCVIGTGGGPVTVMEDLYRMVLAEREQFTTPLAPVMIMANVAPAAIAMHYGLKGESHGIAAACSSGSQAIATAAHMLEHGQLDAVLAGGADACATDWFHGNLKISGALTRSGVARPFDRRRDGMVLGEGGAVLVLERGDVAERRGAQILARLLGVGASMDAFHWVRPDPQGEGPARAIENALADARLAPQDVDYVNAHGTGTKLNDLSETLALKLALGEHAYRVPISAPKSSIGHLIGAAGAVEAVATVMALRERVAPATLHLEEPDEELDLDYVPQNARALPGAGQRKRLVAISNSFAFGGHNVVLVLASDG